MPYVGAMERIFYLTGGQVTPNDWVGVGELPEVKSTESPQQDSVDAEPAA